MAIKMGRTLANWTLAKLPTFSDLLHFSDYFVLVYLLVVYRESVNLIGYLTRRLSADSLKL